MHGVGGRRKIVGREDAPSRRAWPAPRWHRCCARAPCGIGLSRAWQNSMPSARKSSAYFALPGDLREQVRRRVVLADQLVIAAGLSVRDDLSSTSHALRTSSCICAVHQRGENLVVVLAAAQVAGNAVRQFRARGIRVCLQIARPPPSGSPDMQKAHWNPCSSTTPCCTGCSVPSPRPGLRWSCTFWPRTVWVSIEQR